jgi:hypothetical protein
VSLFGMRRRVRRVGPDEFELRLPDDERSVLRTLPAQLRALLEDPAAGDDDPARGRLFPPAYWDDTERDADYQRLMHDDLVASKLAAAEIVESTVDSSRLSGEELIAWMGALNDLRLVLGTRLDVTEDPADAPDDDSPQAPAYALYSYLGWLQEQVVAALDPEY